MYEVLNADTSVVYEGGELLEFETEQEAIQYVLDEFVPDFRPMFVRAPDGNLVALIYAGAVWGAKAEAWSK